MKLIDFIRLIRKHLVLLIITPLALAIMVIYLTANPNYKYTSFTTLYTGITTGSSVEMDKSFNYFASNIAFDNLINIINSRSTKEAVAIRLLALHLMLDKPEEKYISGKSFDKLREITPSYIYSYIVKNGKSIQNNNNYSPYTTDEDERLIQLPSSISRSDYEATVANLDKLMASSDTNFVYDLLNYPNAHYSIKEISTIKVARINSSDMVRIDYESDDPGICQQTLAILTYVCIRNYRNIKENRSDAVVKYFEQQLARASGKLRTAEDELLAFNKKHKIINYYEQSKAVAIVKEDLDVEYNKQRMKLAGLRAAIDRLETKLGLQEQVQLKSSKIVALKDELSSINYQIASMRFPGQEKKTNSKQSLQQLLEKSVKLEGELRDAVSELYTYRNSKEGLPMNSILNDWMTNVVQAVNVQAGLDVLEERIKEFQKQYEIYAPAGANIKRIEREINVSEEEFLEILHGLNLAKLKVQDNELSSNLKVIDRAYFPISAIPTKRKVIVILAGMLGFMFVLSVVIVTEYFDQSLRTLHRADKKLELAHLGLIPKILLKGSKVPINTITKRLTEIICQNIELQFNIQEKSKKSKIVLFFSTQPQEGKSVIAGNIAKQLKTKGLQIKFLDYNPEVLAETVGLSQEENAKSSFEKDDNSVILKNKSSIINRLLGYPDSRIDFNNPFLQAPDTYLSENEYRIYTLNNQDCRPENLFSNHQSISKNSIPDYLFIEIPPILNYSVPINLLTSVDLFVLVCRANRVWNEADEEALKTLRSIGSQPCVYILNGAELQAAESLLGELPKKRNWLQKTIKRIVLLQFSSKTHL